jgi:hypothetical protein
MAHSFESVLFSENHSHKLLGADFYAHGADVSLGIKGLDAGMDLTALKVGFNLYGINLGATMGLANYSYEATFYKSSYTTTNTEYSRTDIGNKYSVENIGNEITTVEGAKATLHEEEVILTSAEQYHLHGTEGITLFGGLEDVSNKFPTAPLVGSPLVPLKLDYEGKVLLMEGALKTMKAFPTPVSFATYTGAKTAVDKATGYLQEWRKKEVKKLIKDGLSNADRKDIKPYNGEIKEDTAQLELKPKTASLASFTSGQALTELVLNSDKNIVEINLRPHGVTLTTQEKNITQKFNLDEPSYFINNYTTDKNFSKLWMTDGAVRNEPTMTVNSAGLLMQSAENVFAKLKLDSALHQIELAVQKDEKNSILQMLNAKKGEYSLEVKVANKTEGSFTMSKDAVALNMPAHGIIVIDSKGATIEASKDILIKSADGDIDLAAKKVKVSTSTFTEGEVKIPARSVSLGNGSNTIKAATDGVTINGSKISLNGTSMFQIKTAIAKIG